MWHMCACVVIFGIVYNINSIKTAFVKNWSATVLKPVSQSAEQPIRRTGEMVPVHSTGLEMAE